MISKLVPIDTKSALYEIGQKLGELDIPTAAIAVVILEAGDRKEKGGFHPAVRVLATTTDTDTLQAMMGDALRQTLPGDDDADTGG